VTALTQWISLNLSCPDALNDVALDLNGEIVALADLLDVWQPDWRDFTQDHLGAIDTSAVRLDPDAPCPHLDFEAGVSVIRVVGREDDPLATIGYTAEIQVACRVCDERFRWTGVPVGLSQAAPHRSVDGLTLHAPFRPATADPDFGMGIPGFSVNLVGPELGHEGTAALIRQTALSDAAAILRGRLAPSNSVGANRALRQAAAELDRAAAQAVAG
jgi:hypothetical protein